MKLKLPVTFTWEWLAQVAALAGLYLSFAWLGSIAAVAPGNFPVVGPASGLGIAVDQDKIARYRVGGASKG